MNIKNKYNREVRANPELVAAAEAGEVDIDEAEIEVSFIMGMLQEHSLSQPHPVLQTMQTIRARTCDTRVPAADSQRSQRPHPRLPTPAADITTTPRRWRLRASSATNDSTQTAAADNIHMVTLLPLTTTP